MKKLLTIIILFSATAAFAESVQFITDGKFQVSTLSNYNEYQIPKEIKSYIHPGDNACMYMNEENGKQFFVFIRKDKMKDFDKGYEFGYESVKMHMKYLTTYNGLKIYEFQNWSN